MRMVVLWAAVGVALMAAVPASAQVVVRDRDDIVIRDRDHMDRGIGTMDGTGTMRSAARCV